MPLPAIASPSAIDNARALYDKLLDTLAFLCSRDTPACGAMYAIFADAIEPVAYALDEALSDEQYAQHDEDAYNAVRVLLMAHGLFQSRANHGVLDEAGAAFHDPNLVIALDIALKNGSESLARVKRRKARSTSRYKHEVPAGD